MKPEQHYIAFGLIMILFLLVFVPKQDIKKLFWFGMLWGSLADFIIETVMCLLNIIRYDHIQPFNIGLLPIWTVLGWTPATILFIYFLPEHKKRYVFWIYILSLAI